MVVDLGHGVFVAVVFVHDRLFGFFVADVDQLGTFDLDECARAVGFVTYPELNRVVVVNYRIDAVVAVPRRFGHVAVFLVNLARVVVAVRNILRVGRAHFARLDRLLARQNRVEPLLFDDQR